MLHQKRIFSLNSLSLSKVLRDENPYLFDTKYVTVSKIISRLVDAHVSSSEETIFGDWLEGLAIFVNEKVYGGRKSGIPNIDLEFDRDNIRFIITIKSGPSWGNGTAIKKMRADFLTAKKTLRTSNSQLHVVAVNGCCYGRDNKPDKGDYFKYCGQTFWEFISGDTDLYTKIVEPLGHKAKEKNDEFLESYAQVINKFTREFSNEFCESDGAIDWEKLARFNSSATPPKKKR